MKYKNLYRTGIFCGFTTLIIGLIIFFVWWIARAFFAIDLNSFEAYGFMWSLISFPIAGFGLLLVLYVLERNYPNSLKETIIGLIIILSNLPIFYLVLIFQGKLESRAYIRIYNCTKQDNTELTIKSASFEKKLGKIDDHESLVTYYYPRYIDSRGGSSYPTPEKVELIIEDRGQTYNVTLPRIEKGKCMKLELDKEFNLTERQK